MSFTCRVPGSGSRKLLTGLGLALSIVLGACGQAATPASSPAPAAGSQPKPAAPASSAPTHVVLRLNWTMSGYFAPFYVALDKGFFKEQHLDVDIQEGKGSVTAVETVANGSDTFGYVEGGAFIQSVGKNVPAIAVAAPQEKSGNAILARADRKIDRLQDLEGRTFGESPGGAAEALFPGLAKQNGLDVGKLKVVNVSSSAKYETLVTGRVDAIPGQITQKPDVELKGVKVNAFSYADYGVPLPGVVLITSKAYLSQHPDTVRAMVAATLKAFAYAEQHPEETAKIAQSHYAQISPELMLAGLQVALPLFHSPESAGKPAGYMDPAAWAKSVQLLKAAGLVSRDIPTSELLTDDYLPKP